MSRVSTLLLSLPLVAAGVSAQNTFIVPSALPGPAALPTATNRGGQIDGQTFWYQSPSVQPVRVQHLWNVTDIAVPAAALLGMNFRRPNSIGNVNPSATANVTIDLSVGPNTAATRSSTFSANAGAVTTVFTGTVNLPQDPNSGAGPAPFNVPVPFTTPFVYVASLGNSLVADMTVSSYVPISANQTWYLDAVGQDAGLRIGNGGEGSQCRFSNGVGQNAIGHINPVLGGQWFVQYQSGSTTRIPTGLIGLGLMGTQGAGSVWNGVPLPLDLTPFGGGTSCALKVGFFLAVLLTENAGLQGIYDWPRITVPNDPALYDASFYEQGLFSDPPANQLGLVTTWSSKWTIRSGAQASGAKLYQYISNGNPTPSPTTGFVTTQATIAQFNY